MRSFLLKRSLVELLTAMTCLLRGTLVDRVPSSAAPFELALFVIVTLRSSSMVYESSWENYAGRDLSFMRSLSASTRFENPWTAIVGLLTVIGVTIVPMWHLPDRCVPMTGSVLLSSWLSGVRTWLTMSTIRLGELNAASVGRTWLLCLQQIEVYLPITILETAGLLSRGRSGFRFIILLTIRCMSLLSLLVLSLEKLLLPRMVWYVMVSLLCMSLDVLLFMRVVILSKFRCLIRLCPRWLSSLC